MKNLIIKVLKSVTRYSRAMHSFRSFSAVSSTSVFFQKVANTVFALVFRACRFPVIVQLVSKFCLAPLSSRTPLGHTLKNAVSFYKAVT